MDHETTSFTSAKDKFGKRTLFYHPHIDAITRIIVESLDIAIRQFWNKTSMDLLNR